MKSMIVSLFVFIGLSSSSFATSGLASDVIRILPGSSVFVNSPVRKTVRCMNARRMADGLMERADVVIRPGSHVVVEANTPTLIRCHGVR